MRIKFLIYILITVLVLSSREGHAQSISLDKLQSVKVNQLSDAQITEAWKKIDDLGIPEQDAYKLLEQRGMDPIEVNLFKQRISLLGLNKGGVKIAEVNKKDDIDFSRDTINIVSKPIAVATSKVLGFEGLGIYGTDFFNQTTIKFDPDFNIATPKGYIVGPGDELIILLTGLNESSVSSKVTPEGNLQVPYAGIVYVNGFSIDQASKLIRTKMAKVYPAINSGQSQVTINLGNTRTIKVTLVGEVKTPGSYTVSSLATLKYIKQ